jgi:succinate dehydrogenase / fumarate reductase, membrane anchor subunit
MNYQTPLARARGLGSARSGSNHWWRQRVTAIALIPLTFWLAVSIAKLPDASYERVVLWVTAPWNTILLLSFIALGFFHALLGIQVVIEDYVHSDWLKVLSILSVKLLTGFLTLAAVFATLRIAFLG